MPVELESQIFCHVGALVGSVVAIQSWYTHTSCSCSYSRDFYLSMSEFLWMAMAHDLLVTLEGAFQCTEGTNVIRCSELLQYTVCSLNSYGFYPPPPSNLVKKWEHCKTNQYYSFNLAAIVATDSYGIGLVNVLF